jgi:hypothetical protein
MTTYAKMPWAESAADFARLAQRPLTATEKSQAAVLAQQEGCRRVRAYHLALILGGYCVQVR